MKAQLIATIESRRFWIALLGLAAAVAQAIGHPIPSGVFDAGEAFLAVLFAGDSYVVGQHVGNTTTTTESKPAA